MASSTEFSLFAKLPAELRVRIWELSILEHQRDRLVPMDEFTKRIIYIRNLASSSHFRATYESRKVATSLYPIRFPVYITAARNHNTDLYLIEDPASQVDDDAEADTSEYRPAGAIYISTEHDIFIFGLVRLGSYFLSRERCTIPSLDGQGNFGRRSPALSWSQCQSMRRIMFLDRVRASLLKDECHGTPNCVVRCGALRYYNTWYNSAVFSGVKRCLFAVLDGTTLEIVTLYLNTFRHKGPRMLEYLEGKNWLACFDAEDVKKYQEEGKSSECVCVMREGQV